MALTEREKIDKWKIEERILSNSEITLWLRYEDDEVVDFRWKTENDSDFKHSSRCIEFYERNSEKLYGSDVAKIATAIDFYNQFNK